MPGETHPKCATVGCGKPATFRVTYRYRDSADTDTDAVCTECNEEYSLRVVLRDYQLRSIQQHGAWAECDCDAGYLS